MHGFDATAINPLTVYSKVHDVLNGKIPNPTVVEFFITNFCSFKCPHCRCAKMHESNDSYISLELIKRALDKIAGINCKIIEFGGGGEPLEHPYIIEILHMLHERNMRCGIITNGYNLIDNIELVNSILPVADWVRISLDAVTENSYKLVHGKKELSYQKLKKTLYDFSTRAAKNGDIALRTRLGIKLIIQKYNQFDIEQSFHESIEMGADYLQFKWLETHAFSIPNEERYTIIDLFHKIKDKYGNTGIPFDVLSGYSGDTPNSSESPCLLSVLYPVIDWDGKIYICAFFHHRKNNHCLGDLAEESFVEIWNSNKHREKIEEIQTHQCVPNCPIKRYEPVVEFIRQSGNSFLYI
jgi:radical SAM protein with 4Fe4S-binding SPASM domain